MKKNYGAAVRIPGHKINNTSFNATVNEALLLKLVGDPRKAEDKALANSDIRLRELQEMREEVQRGFHGEKDRNVGSFAAYIENMKQGGDGTTP